jgi:hypothetical protein
MQSWVLLAAGAVVAVVVLLMIVFARLAAPVHEDRHPPS